MDAENENFLGRAEMLCCQSFSPMLSLLAIKPAAFWTRAIRIGCLAACLFSVHRAAWADDAGAEARGASQVGDNADPANSTPFDTSSMPSDTSIAIVVRPAELAKSEILRPMVAAFDQALQRQKLGLSVSDIAEFKLVMTGTLLEMVGEPNCQYMIIRSVNPHDWKPFAAEQFGDGMEAELYGRKYFLGTKRSGKGDNSCYWLPDDRTIVVGTTAGIARTLVAADPNDIPTWSGMWQKAANCPLACFVQLTVFGDLTLGPNPKHPVAENWKTLTHSTEIGLLQGECAVDGFAISARLENGTEESAKKAAAALPTFLAGILEEWIAEQTREARDRGDEGVPRTFEELSTFVNAAKISTQEASVAVEFTMNRELIRFLAECLLPGGN